VSGAGEPPPCALSDTDVNLSTHPAPIIQPSVQTTLPSSQVPPIKWLTFESGWIIQPLRSISITETSTLLRVGPPLCPASVLSPSWVLHFGVLPYHRNDRFPRSTHEPDSGSRYLYAGRRPGSIQVSPGLILVSHKLPVLTSSNFISTPHQ